MTYIPIIAIGIAERESRYPLRRKAFQTFSFWKIAQEFVKTAFSQSTRSFQERENALESTESKEKSSEIHRFQSWMLELLPRFELGTSSLPTDWRPWQGVSAHPNWSSKTKWYQQFAGFKIPICIEGIQEYTGKNDPKITPKKGLCRKIVGKNLGLDLIPTSSWQLLTSSKFKQFFCPFQIGFSLLAGKL